MSFSWNALLSEAWPQITLLGSAFLCLMSAVSGSKRAFRLSTLLALIGLGVAAWGFFSAWQSGQVFRLEVLHLDPFANALSLLATLITAVAVLYSFRYWENLSEPITEAVALMLFALLGMSLMVSTTHLLTLILSLEVMSLSLYVLVGCRRQDLKSSEAALKYFILGSVAAAFLLFGTSLLYGATGSMDLAGIMATYVGPEQSLLFRLGVVLLLAGFAFKLAAVPLHFWAPDVYAGAPAPITGFMAAGVKVAAFGALLRILQVLIQWEGLELAPIFTVLAVLTMVVGNFTALRQTSLKRILAYSSIAHAGYLFLGVAALLVMGEWNDSAFTPIIFYLAVYALLTLGAFALLTLFSSEGREVDTLQDLKGLASHHPFFAAALSIFLISLAGIPPTAGFFAKYGLFTLIMGSELYWPAAIGILSSAVSLYYYLGPVVRMYFEESEAEPFLPKASWVMKVLVIFLLSGVLYLGIFPGKALELASNARIQSPTVNTVQR